MSNDVFSILQERGFVEQVSDEAGLRDSLASGPVTCYAGFDPTGRSLHVGHLLPIMALAHMQRSGHRPIVLAGGGTALIGDPSGKNEMRRILSHDEIERNLESIKEQFSHYLMLDGDTQARVLNNAEWLVPLRYIDFLRDIGRHFSVNRMLAAESYKMRLETGLNFIEFNYMLLQAYDFWYLHAHHECVLQIGGNDQWGNIVAGIELIRRMSGGAAYGLTFPLITTAGGAKMGKTEKGAVWLAPEMTSPYEYYQYWRNCDDRDVYRFLALFTFMPMEEIAALESDRSENALRKAKEMLALEAAAVTHGRDEAIRARNAAQSVFYGAGGGDDSLPSSTFAKDTFEQGVPAFILFHETKLCPTRSEARRLISAGGAYANGKKIDRFDELIDISSFNNDQLLLRAGKKRYHKVIVE